MKHGLGRIPSPFDARDWPVERLALLIAEGTALPVTWTDPVVLDQGQTPTCVGNAGAGWVASAEANAIENSTITEAFAQRLYVLCKARDGDNQDGTTVRTLAKVLKDLGYIDAYAFGTYTQGAAWVAIHGPCVTGERWDYSMEETDAQGYVHPDGSDAGGHSTLWIGVNGPGDRNRNSWGKAWGLGGDFLVTATDFRDILSNGGEVMMAVKYVKPAPIPVPPAPTPTPPPAPPTPPAPPPAPSDVAKLLRRIISTLKAALTELERLLKDVT